MTGIELIGVPFDGYGRIGNQARAAQALRDSGLVNAIGADRVVSHSDISLPPREAARGIATSLINETALIAMTESLADRIGKAVAAGRFPVVYGGDCASLFGTVTGLRDHVPETGLVFVDGHEDTMPLDVSEDGEAANTEIGLLLGLTGRLLQGPLADRLPALRTDQLVVIGARDERWRQRFNVGSLADVGVWCAPLTQASEDPTGVGERGLAHLRTRYDRWWLHVDLDVLDPVEFPAQGLPDFADEPGGLTWSQLTELAVTMLESGGCVGCSFAIYDPDQDPDGADAEAIVRFIGTLMHGRP